MKRNFQNMLDEAENENKSKLKVVLVEREPKPQGVSLVNLNRISKKTHVELMELEDGLNYADTFIKANAKNKLDIIGRQMKNLQGLMNDVINETKWHSELNNVACNFTKKPGHTYHLYERPSGQKYFGMLSPEEWVNAPHNFLGSFRLEADQSWTPADQEHSRYEGINYLKDIFSHPSGMRALSSNI